MSIRIYIMQMVLLNRALAVVTEPVKKHICTPVHRGCEIALDRKSIAFEKERNARLLIAVEREVRRQHAEVGLNDDMVTTRANEFHDARLPNDTYFVFDKYLGDLEVVVSDKQVAIVSWHYKDVSTQKLRAYLQRVHDRHFANENSKSNVYMINKQMQWAFITDTYVQPVEQLDAVRQDLVWYLDAQFVEENQMRSTKVLLHGPVGVGKTTMVRYIAGRYNMPIYSVTYTPGLNNTDLISLMAKVPECSVLVFDEAETKLKVPFENDRIDLSADGLVEALDGIIPLKPRVFVFFVVNDLAAFHALFDEGRMRVGRIDKTVHLTERVHT